MTDIYKGTKLRMREAYVGGVRRALTEVQLIGDTIPPVSSILTVQGISKGKGFAGVVKRHGFAGGPRTHGQSDRHRAPGSIGQGTTPGRVRRRKKMAGRMGGDTKSVKQAVVVAVQGSNIFVTGPVPGPSQGALTLRLQGQAKSAPVIIPGVTIAEPPKESSNEN